MSGRDDRTARLEDAVRDLLSVAAETRSVELEHGEALALVPEGWVRAACAAVVGIRAACGALAKPMRPMGDESTEGWQIDTEIARALEREAGHDALLARARACGEEVRRIAWAAMGDDSMEHWDKAIDAEIARALEREAAARIAAHAADLARAREGKAFWALQFGHERDEVMRQGGELARRRRAVLGAADALEAAARAARTLEECRIAVASACADMRRALEDPA